MIASLSPEKSNIINLSTGQDVKSTEKCLKNCNISINDTEKSEKIIFGDTFMSPDKELDCGNSGTTMRLLSGLLPSKNIQATLFGDQSLSRRPMGRIIKPLSEMGVRIKGANEKPPLMITKSEYHSIDYKNRIPSAQVKSAVLFAGLGASGITKFSEPFLSRNHTEIMLKNVGANIKTNKNEISISSNSQKLAPLNITVPSDPSTAAFFAGAVAIIPKSNLIINNILTNPTRFGFFTSLKQMGLELDLLSEKSILEARNAILDLHLSDDLEQYIVNIVVSTRNPGKVNSELDGQILYGASPRACMGIDRAARAYAWLKGKDYVGPEDIQEVAHDVLRHRLVLSFEAEADGISSNHIIDRILSGIGVP